ncbi:MAG: SAM-dependent methyltransferase [Candidatus Nanoarchaeia archaeon]
MVAMVKYIIEHLEPKLYPWCFLEYKHISKIVGKGALIFSNTKNLSQREVKKLEKLGKVWLESISNKFLNKFLNIKHTNACILDPNATKELTPKIAKQYNYFIFGGILGDNPPKARTTKFLTSKLNLPAYNLGKEQMSTDTAVAVCKEIYNGTSLKNLKFQDGYSVKIEKWLWEELPYRYLIKNGKVLFTPGLKKLLKNLAKKGI